MECELQTLELEKTELLKERDSYRNLTELERQIQEDKKVLDSQRLEFLSLLD